MCIWNFSSQKISRYARNDRFKNFSIVLFKIFRVTDYRLLTVITKADLWWHLGDRVFSHYEKGEYFQGLGAAQPLGPAVTHHCSVFHKLYGIGPLSGHFDEQDRILARANLLKSMIELVGKGGTNA
uniref:Uncharacterized protein n=1 Tax=Candidatus Kentrum sp. LFY TaxID=2126342 RepID=A0A450W8L4_9GAMM|nr:MAG: hypothetical protein BECKLFY1418C_GA0070996_100323 [Candidatus Kentron sp. LFY]